MNRNKGNKTYRVTRILACCFPVKICQWLQTDCGHKNVVVIKIVNCCGHKNSLKNFEKNTFWQSGGRQVEARKRSVFISLRFETAPICNSDGVTFSKKISPP